MDVLVVWLVVLVLLVIVGALILMMFASQKSDGSNPSDLEN